MEINPSLKILLGPVKNNSELGKAAISLGIKCFSDSDADIILNIEKDRFQDILNRLPSGWFPDIVIFWSPEYNTLPLDIEKVPCPVIAVVGDWNLGFSALKENLKRFDWIMTDKAGVEIFKKAGYQNINYWPMFSFNPDVHKILENVEKIYDIVFIGNFNHMIHSERVKWLHRVSMLASRYKVKLFSGIYHEEYTKVLNQAKIVFNHSVRGEMNMRAYEAPACGSLLFMEETNLEIRDFLTDKKECILYNSENFEMLIDYYLQHDNQREQITRAGNQKIQQETFENHLLKLLSIINEKKIYVKKTVPNSFSLLNNNNQLYQSAVSAIQGITKGSLQLAGNLITKGLEKEPENPDLWNALIVLYATTALQLEGEQKNLLLNKSLLLLDKAISYSPDSVILYYNKANISFHLNNKEKAKISFLKVIELLKSGKALFKNCNDLFFPRTYDSFRVEWEKVTAYYSDQPVQLSGKYKELLAWRTNESLGDISFDFGDYFEAKNYYNKSISSFKDLISKAGTNLAISLIKLGRKQEAVKAFYQAIQSNLSEISNYYYLVELLFELKHFEECIKICKDVLTMIDAIPAFEEKRLSFDSFLKQCFQAGAIHVRAIHELPQQQNNSIEDNQPLNFEPDLEKLPEITDSIARKKKFNIFIFCWHTPYLYLLAKTGHNFEMANWTTTGDGKTGWKFAHRPIPENVKLINNVEEIKNKIIDNYFDLVICQTEYEISFLERYDIPVIYLAHNYLSSDTGSDKMKMFMVRKKVKNFLNIRKSLFVAISSAKLANWNLPGMVILPGLDAEEYNGYEGNKPEVITVSSFFKERDFMMGYTIQKEIIDKLPYQIIGYNPKLPKSIESKNWEEQKSFYSNFRVYLNTTIAGAEDGYNLSMLEAMASGMPVVSFSSPTSPITDGINGFISDDILYLRDKLKLLLNDLDLAKKIGQKGRQTVIEKFSIDNFINNWNKAFDYCLNSKQDKYNYKHFILSGEDKQKKPKVILASAFNPNFLNFYYERAFRKHCDVITCGPSFVYNDFKVWNSALEQSNFEDNLKFTELAARILLPADIPLGGGEIDIEEILNLLPAGWKPDLFVWIDSNTGFLPVSLQNLQCPAICFVYDENNFSWKLDYAKLYNHIFVLQNHQLKDFEFFNAEWLPSASEPQIYNKIYVEKTFDISFIGQTTPQFYPERRKFLQKIIDQGFDLHIENNILQEMSLIYNRSKIIINCSLNGELNNRIFEAMGSGSLLLTDRVTSKSGLLDLFTDRQHLVLYNEDNLTELLNYYLNNTIEREFIAKQGREEVLKKHTYSNRVKVILNKVLNWSDTLL